MIMGVFRLLCTDLFAPKPPNIKFKDHTNLRDFTYIYLQSSFMKVKH